jgi:phage terminase small subunit
MKQKIRLPKTGRALERMLVDTYKIEQGGALAIVEICKQALDQAIAAEKLIEEHGQLITGERGGLKMNPACNISRDARNRLLNALGKLNLEL